MSKKKQSGPMRVSAPRAPVEPVGEIALTTTRIDPPHPVASAEPSDSRALPIAEPSESPPRLAASQPAAFVQPLAQTFEQMQSQAAQLAAQLCKQQASLDHREAEVDARAAAVESQVRTARLWLAEKLEELAQRKAELNPADPAGASPAPTGQVPQAPASSGSGLADAGIPTGNSAASEPNVSRGSPRFWKQLHWQEEFERWCSEREAAAEVSAASHDRGPDEPSSRAAAASAPSPERLRAAEQQLAARAAQLEAWQRELAANRDALEDEREAFARERQADLVRLAEQRRVMSEKLARQRARLHRRRDDFDAREMALRRLRADLLRTQQQALEMRLGAEEMWARARGKAPAAEERSPRSDLRHHSRDIEHEGSD